MKHKIPRSPFATRLSGSARETELRILNIFQGPKKRPPVPIMILAALLILSCGWLVSCQPMEPEISPDPAASVSTADDFQAPTSSGSGTVLSSLTLLTSGGAGEFYLSEQEPADGQEAVTETVAALHYRSSALGDNVLYTLDYGPDHPYWYAVSLEAFSGVLGYDGAVFSYDIGAAWHAYDYFAVTENSVFLLARCFNDVWTQDLDGDGTEELLSNYHNMGYLDVYQRSGNGHVSVTQVNTSCHGLVGAPQGTWLQFSRSEEPGKFTACWFDKGGAEHTDVLPGSFISHAALHAFHYEAPNGQQGQFYWEDFQSPGDPTSEPYTVSAYWDPSEKGNQQQKLFTLDFSGSPVISYNTDGILPFPQLGLEPFTDILGQDGVIFTYDKGGRQVQHFFCVDEHGQANPLALCDPGWQAGDLDGDGVGELWSLSEDGRHFYFYHVDPEVGGQPRFAFVCGLSGNAPEAFRNFDRAFQNPDGSFSLVDSSGTLNAVFSAAELLAYINEYNAWFDQIPDWTAGGRVDQYG